jgi:hypothetical protein
VLKRELEEKLELTDLRVLLIIDYCHDIVQVLVNVCFYTQKYSLSSVYNGEFAFALFSKPFRWRRICLLTLTLELML